MNRFSNTSSLRLATCHEDLQLIMEEALCDSVVDMGIACGHRSVADQQKAYAQGRTTPGNVITKVDGVKVKSKHNYDPSLAVDIYAYVPGKSSLTWDEKYLIYLGGVITSTANRLLSEGLVTHKLRWGYNWDGDGEIGTDQKFQDLPHFELVEI